MATKVTTGFSYIDEDAISNDLKCPVCISPLEDPVVHQDGKCDNTFCRGCLSGVTVCPLCRGTENLRQPAPRAFKNVLAALRVKCDVCETEMNRGDVLTHERACRRACANECGYVGVELESHVEVCPLAPASCLHCGESVLRSGVNKHNRKCPRKPVKCAVCAESVPREEMNVHVADECTATEVLCCGALHSRRDYKEHMKHCVGVAAPCGVATSASPPTEWTPETPPPRNESREARERREAETMRRNFDFITSQLSPEARARHLAVAEQSGFMKLMHPETMTRADRRKISRMMKSNEPMFEVPKDQFYGRSRDGEFSAAGDCLCIGFFVVVLALVYYFWPSRVV